MRPANSRHRTDGTAKALAAHAKALGVGYEPLGGAVDGLLFLGHVLRLVDWKTPGKAALTPSQGRLLARGCAIAFVSTPQQLEALVHDMKRQARQG